MATQSSTLARRVKKVTPKAATQAATGDRITGSVGRDCRNLRKDVLIVQRVLNANLPVPMAPLTVDGNCGSRTIAVIEEYQRRVLKMDPPDGKITPKGPTFRALTGGAAPPQPTPVPPQPTPGPVAGDVPRPDRMRESAWRYLLEFTKKHEGAVLYMYNNRTASMTDQDVTCGIGFRIDKRSDATQSWLKIMFFDKNTGAPATDAQMLADWDAAAGLSRTSNNLKQYGEICQLRMRPELVYRQMALILRDRKLPALLSSFPQDFGNFENYPAAAQTFCLSFAYGRIPFDFPQLRASVRAERWADAAEQCHLRGASEAKNKAHKQLLIFAQKV